jgi:hypothetical protein
LATISVHWEGLSVLRIAEAGDAAMAGGAVEGIEVYSRERHQQIPADPAELRTKLRIASGTNVCHMLKLKCGIG